MKVLACNSNRPLAEAISAYLNIELTKASIRRFSDMEVFVEILENVRGEDVFVVQSTSYPANDNLMELRGIVFLYVGNPTLTLARELRSARRAGERSVPPG